MIWGGIKGNMKAWITFAPTSRPRKILKKYLFILKKNIYKYPKVESILFFIKEGVKQNKNTYKNKIQLIIFRLFNTPILGYILKTITILFTLPSLMKKINIKEAHAGETITTMQEKINQLSSKVSQGDLKDIVDQLSFHIKYRDRIHEKKVLICCNAYPPNFIGGAELIAHYQALELQKQGYAVKVFAGDFHIDTKHYGTHHDTYDGIEVFRVKLTPADFDTNGINFRHHEVEEYFQKVLNEYQPNIVHMHNIIGLSVLLATLAKKYHIKTFLTLHDGWGFCYKNTMMKNDGNSCHNFSECAQCMPSIHDDTHSNIPLVMRENYLALALNKVDMFISPSYYLREQYIKAGFNANKILVLANGIDVAKFDVKKITSNKIHFTCIGHLGEHKGVLLILQALSSIEDKEKLHINIVGEGPLEENLKNYISDNQLSEYVTLFGKVSNEKIVTIFAQTDVYIIPSMWPENQPVTITEAFSSKIPVIGTNLGGIKELIIPNKTGLLFPMGNANALAESMLFFIKNPESISIYGNNAYQFIKEKTFTNQVKELSLHYLSSFSISVEKKPFVISCIGDNISQEILEIIDMLNKENKQIYFLLHTWLTDPYSCDIVWFIDNINTLAEIKNYAYLQKPFLLSDTYKEYCIKHDNGMTYNTTQGAIESILYLFEHQDACVALGENQIRSHIENSL